MDTARYTQRMGALEKLLMKAEAATISITRYCQMVTVSPAHTLSAGISVKVRLHCSIFTAYFWKGKMAE